MGSGIGWGLQGVIMAANRSGVKESGPSPTSPSRVIIEGVSPEIDGGRFPIKRVVGEDVEVSADVFAEGHDVLKAIVKHRPMGADTWTELVMAPGVNDRWSASFLVDAVGRHTYNVEAWVDRFASWFKEVGKKVEANQEVSSELLEGAELIREAASRASVLESGEMVQRVKEGTNPELLAMMNRYPDRSRGFTYDRTLNIIVERVRARFGSWYEFFPRSTAKKPGEHGTFATAADHLDYVASMNFDVVYLPPIHPIGTAYRKGPNNTLTPGPDDPGSPWAIGNKEGGHKATHPELGTLADFDALVSKAKSLNLEIALDIAFQCSPDHPYVKEHPLWFRHRPDGTIKYAENPPKKYQDIYPIDFECDDWESLYAELRDVFLFWIGHGVNIFRVDNPHTKPFRFWDWVIQEVLDRHPDTIFLAEAFTRPKIMHRLAKGGYPQSYSYFTWRTTKKVIEEYFTELTQTATIDYMRPNLFANTPDILHEFLQVSGRPGFQIRLVLAATLGATYGIYGPTYELCIGTPWKPGSEEYLDSEKYQVQFWDLDQPRSLRDYIARINLIRRENPALQSDRSLRFVPTDNEAIIAYIKTTDDLTDSILVVVNLDPHHVQAGWVEVPVDHLGLAKQPGQSSYQVHDLIGDARYLWSGESNYVQLDPQSNPAHVFRIRRKTKTERDFDYFV